MIDRLQRRARAEYVSHRFGGHYEIHGVFDPATATAEVTALRDGIASLTDGSVASKQLFAVARRAVAMRAAAGPLSSSAWAQELVHTVELGQDLAWRQQLADRAMRVTYDDVQRVLLDELRPGNATWLVAGPEDAVRSVYSALGLAPTAL
jgi:predicted Zn-dependent peptidase